VIKDPGAARRSPVPGRSDQRLQVSVERASAWLDRRCYRRTRRSRAGPPHRRNRASVV